MTYLELAFIKWSQFIWQQIRRHPVLSTCHFVNSPFCQLAILLAPLCNLTFEQLNILSTNHCVKMPFCQLDILSYLPFCQLDIWATHHFVILSACHFVYLPLCHFANLPLCQLATLSTCHFVNLPFYKPLKENLYT